MRGGAAPLPFNSIVEIRSSTGRIWLQWATFNSIVEIHYRCTEYADEQAEVPFNSIVEILHPTHDWPPVRVQDTFQFYCRDTQSSPGRGAARASRGGESFNSIVEIPTAICGAPFALAM